MIEINITSDIDEAIDEVGDFFRGDIPFVTAVAINNTLFDIRRRNIGSTYPKAFKVRNVTFPKVNWTIDKVAIGGGKSQNIKASSGLKAFKGGWSNNMFGMYRQKALNGGMREWTELQVDGGTKTPRGSAIAIPVNGDSMRNKGGSISKRNKPRNITNRKDTFLVKDKAGRKKFIASRSGGKLDVKFTFAKTANIKPRYRFYEDAFDTVDRVILPHWGTALATVVARSRFDPG